VGKTSIPKDEHPNYPADLAIRAGMHPDSVGRWERGDWPGGSRIDNIRKLAEALGVDPRELVADK
jgi:transcriptional regulator with XRE-family HTH domain